MPGLQTLRRELTAGDGGGGKLDPEVFIFLTRGTTMGSEDTRQKADSRDAQICVCVRAIILFN